MQIVTEFSIVCLSRRILGKNYDNLAAVQLLGEAAREITGNAVRLLSLQSENSQLSETGDWEMTMEETKEIKKFFHALFDETEGFIEIRTIRNTNKVRQEYYPTGEIEQLSSGIIENELLYSKDANAYFGVCPREKREGKEKNINQMNCLWVDIDCANEKGRGQKLNSLEEFDRPPSMIIDSGHGFHGYWLFDKPHEVKNEEDLLRLKGYVKGLAQALGGDSAFDLSRVLRIPGTQNTKDPFNPLPVTVLKMNPNRKYKLTDFQKFWVQAEKSSIYTDITLDEIPDRYWTLLEKDSKLRATWKGERNDLKDGSRSGHDMALASLLMPYGFSNSQIAAIMRASPSGKGKEAKKQYLARTIGNARMSWQKSKRIVSLAAEGSKKGKDAPPSRIKFNPRPYSKEILANHALKYDHHKRFWVYNENTRIWESEARLWLNSMLRKRILGEKDYKRYCVAEIMADLEGLSYTDEEIEEPEAHLIPFKNKIYDLENDEFLDYSPDYFFINKLAVKVNNESTECPTIDRIFEELVEPDDVITLYEILAYALYRSYLYHKMFILYGSGANGKTAYIKILRRCIGSKNMSLVGVNDLQYNRFASSQLFGKFLNVSGEMDYKILRNTSKLKQCCGEDLIYCERKFREPFPFVNYAKMVFLTNQVPLTADRTSAFYRRIFLLEFPSKFILGENADPMLVKRIPEEEFEGLVWKCLRHLRRLRDSGFIFTNHSTIENVTKRYEDLSDPLNKFLDENTEKDADSHISVGEFSDKYIPYLKENGLRLWTLKEIGKSMKGKGIEQKSLSDKNEYGNPTTVRSWLGLKWKKVK